MKNIFLFGIFFALILAIPAHADTKVKIDTVPSTYTPQNFSRTERVRMSSYHFEVSQQTSRVRLVVVYTYRDQISYAHGDDGGGPKNTEIELPGLTYDATNHAVVYDAGGKKTVCATVQEKSGPTGHHLDAKNTPACTVTTVVADHVEDAAWDNSSHAALDVYLNVQ